ncbi:MAG: FAD:protein FMN transferase [Gemmatimonadota bacterium]
MRPEEWRRGGIALLLAALLNLHPLAAVAQGGRFEYRELHMGVEVRLVLQAAGQPAADSGARAAFAAVAVLEQRLSDWRPTSEVRQLTLHPRQWRRVSVPLYQVLARAVELARASEGAFDPTAGPLVALWREARRTRRLPDSGAVAAARARTGWRLLRLRPASREVWLERDSMLIDLGGIAKGFILDQAGQLLRRRGISRFLIEAGGDIVVGDAPAGRPGWEIAVKTPRGDTTLALVNVGVGTSGPGAQHLDLDGVRYSHVIDPRTGWALTRAIEVTVVHPVGALSDALATLVTVAPRAGARIARKMGAVLILEHDTPLP